MKLNVTKIDENRRLVVGTVKNISARDKVVNIKLEGEVYNKDKGETENETLEIAFWNGTVPLADRLLNAGVSEGSVIAVEIYEKDGKITANNFKYKGHWHFPDTATSKSKDIFMGVVGSVTEGTASSGSHYTRISMPEETRKDEESSWISITFWDSETSNVAERAAKLLAKRDDHFKRAIVRCKERGEYNGKKQYTGYEFDLLPDQTA